MAKKKTYEPIPEVPQELAERYRVMLEVLSGKRSVSSGARLLGLSRNHFQTLMHRALRGLMQGLAPKAPGPSPKPPKEAALEEEQTKLRKENAKLRDRVDVIDRMLSVAGDLLRGRISTSGRPRKTKTKRGDPEKPDEGSPGVRLAAARGMRMLGLTLALAAAAVGVSATTLARWSRRERRGEAPVHARGPERSAPLDVVTEATVEDVVRELEGQVGADALRHAVPGVSRRKAAAAKADAVTAMERERKAAATRVLVTAPGILRGFDAIQIQTLGGWRFGLVAGDAAVPYRTSAPVVLHYDGPSVAHALDADFRANGAPLVTRLDRALAHATDDVLEVFAAYGVLVLHGPPRFPQYYGQLERMNREHRAHLDSLGLLEPDALAPAIGRMLRALNGLWPRRTLAWRTAEEVWRERPPVLVDRTALRDEVRDRADRIRHGGVRGAPADLAERLAIEQALIKRGFLVVRKADGAR